MDPVLTDQLSSQGVLTPLLPKSITQLLLSQEIGGRPRVSMITSDIDGERERTFAWTLLLHTRMLHATTHY